MIGKDKLAFNAFWWDHLWDGDSIKQAAHSIAGLGYRGVEWKETSFNPENRIAGELKRAARISKAEGLEVPDVAILRGITDPESCRKSVDDIVGVVRGCAEAGIKRVNIITGGPAPEKPISGDWWAPRFSPAKAAWDTLRESLASILEVASRNKTYLVLEAAVGCIVHDYFTTRQLYTLIDSPFLCLTLDPSHYQLYRNDVPWAIRQLGPERIRHVHLKDSVGIPGDIDTDFIFPLLGEGSMDWIGFFHALDDIKYNGYLSVEFESWKYMNDVLKNDPVEAARISMRSAAALLDNYSKWKETMP